MKLRIASLAVCYRERRLLEAHLVHHQPFVDKQLVLASSIPWQGSPEPEDGSIDIARRLGASVIQHNWKTEADQRNTGLDYLRKYDWVLVLDPDEFITGVDWQHLTSHLETAELGAYVTGAQETYWKTGFVIRPREDYKQIIAIRPRDALFIDKRVVNCAWACAPTLLHHFSWARTDAECLSKISHYSHAR